MIKGGISLFIFFFVAVNYVLSSELTWEQLKNGHHFYVKGLHDENFLFEVNGNSEIARQNFLLRKVYDSPHAFKRDEWQIMLKSPEGNSLQFSDARIEVKFDGGRIFPFNPTETRQIYSVKSVCQPISKIIFDEINNSLLNKISSRKESDKEITLDNLFSKLKEGHLKQFIDNLPDSDTYFTQCVEVFYLMRYMKNDKRFGFATKSYELPKSMLSYLKNLSDVLNGYDNSYTLKDAMISIVGYTDAREIGKEEPIKEGVEVRYFPSTCPENEVIEPIFVVADERNESTRIYNLVNNCQLSAARAKMVLDFLKSNIHSEGVEYRYAAGGTRDGRIEDIPENRSISITIRMDAGKKS